MLRAVPLATALAGASASPAAAQTYGPGLVEQPIRVQGTGNSVVVEGGTTIQPREPYPNNYSGTGVQVLSGAQATLKADEGTININVHGHAADGLFVGAGKITVHGGGTYINVVTDDVLDTENSRGIYTVGDSRSEFDGTNLYVTTRGSNSDALRSYGALATVHVRDSTLTTVGDRSRGVTTWGGANLTLDNVAISTQGQQSYGVWLTSGATGQDTHVTMNGGSVQTTGYQANGVLAQGGTRFTGNGTSVYTTGDAYAVEIRGGRLDGSGMDIRADGSRALVVSGSGALVDLANSSIRTTKGSTQTVWVSGGSVTLNGATVTADGANSIPVWTTGGQTAINGGRLSTTADTSRALLVQGGAVALGMYDGNGTVVQTTGANADAAGVLNGAQLSADGASLLAEGPGSLALRIYGDAAETPNTVNLRNTTVSSAQADGLYFYGGHGVVNMDGGSVTGGRRAVWVASAGGVAGASGVLNATNGALIVGQVGAAAGNTIEVNLSNDARWDVTVDSTVNALSNVGGLVDLQAAPDVASRPTDASAYRQLQVSGNYMGNNGSVALNTYLNSGGAWTNQHTDRLLIAGDASGTSVVHVKAVEGSPGGVTSFSAAMERDQGISIVQVGGQSSGGAFALQGGYVTAVESPYTYRLYAYGPGSALGSADPANSLVGNPGGYWDYRLQSAYVTPDGPIPEPDPYPGTDPLPGPGPTPDPAPEPEYQGEEVRAQIVPQVASYLTAPIALQYATYADLDSLHRRLGEIRDDRAMGLDGGKGEAFFRAYGGHFSYESNRDFLSYGYNASGDYGAAQLGGNLFKRPTEAGVWRFGAAFSYGQLRYHPDAPDGPSKTRTNIYRLSTYATYQADRGWYVDGILSFGWFDGDVSTDARGKAMDLKGTSLAASVETGYPVAVGYGMNLEPQLQVIAQHLKFDRQTDVDDLDVDIGSSNQVLGRLGVRLARPMDVGRGRVTPYAGVHVVHAFNGATNVEVGEVTFRTGQYGDAMRYSAGVTGTVNERLSLYGEVARLQAMGSGMDSWLFNGGVRYRF